MANRNMRLSVNNFRILQYSKIKNLINKVWTNKICQIDGIFIFIFDTIIYDICSSIPTQIQGQSITDEAVGGQLQTQQVGVGIEIEI